MTRFQLRWTITEQDADKVIKDFLKEKHVSKMALTDIKFNGGFIKVNGIDQTVRYLLKYDDVLTVGFPEECPSEGIKAEAISLNILYEDEHVIVVNKPAHMSTIPSREHPSGSLANALIGYYEQKGLKATAHIVTRLDRDTSGMVLIAKHRHVHHLLSEQQKNGGVRRVYEAFAEGTFPFYEGKIEEPIARKKDSIIEREVHSDGQYACTFYQVIRSYQSFTHLKLQLETGRTHQIRVHMSYLGHPLLGDDLYGGKVDLISRQALHCRELSFYHPFLEKQLTFKQEFPDDMRQLI
ncbi:RluA family pseudouridine synthase [Cytobacillus sp. FJAT-53684]|uniref:Pseudouridine synthase n=1 Tax=Cytobacillus mangrovibacter TaxID=3299024 RepID=A0ABW6JX17_9BACI